MVCDWFNEACMRRCLDLLLALTTFTHFGDDRVMARMVEMGLKPEAGKAPLRVLEVGGDQAFEANGPPS